MNINEIGAKAGHCCEYEAPMPMDSRTIKDNIRETTEQLHIIEGMVDSLSRMLWAKDAVNEKTSITSLIWIATSFTIWIRPDRFTTRWNAFFAGLE